MVCRPLRYPVQSFHPPRGRRLCAVASALQLGQHREATAWLRAGAESVTVLHRRPPRPRSPRCSGCCERELHKALSSILMVVIATTSRMTGGAGRQSLRCARYTASSSVFAQAPPCTARHHWPTLSDSELYARPQVAPLLAFIAQMSPGTSPGVEL